MNKQNADEVRDTLRRKILLWIPAAIFGAISATLAATAYRFLRPPTATEPSGGAGAWTPIAPLTELKGARPIARKVSLEQRAGWSATSKESLIYISAQTQPTVFSAVCPHEGCDVEWIDNPGEFNCPCHDSRFGADGARLSGPAASGLTRIPARVVEGILEIQPPAETQAASGRSSRGRA